MGHKVNPTGFRIGVIKGWQAKWYSDRHYAGFLEEDLRIRQAIDGRYRDASISNVEIERQANQVLATIYTARPGIVIGRGGQRVDETRNILEKLVGKRIQLNIKEVQQPELDARLVARNIADQIERRIAYRRAMKQAIARTMQAGGKGIKVACAGRLGGAEIARRLNMHEGRVPLHTLRADIDYGFIEARTVMGRIGCKVWIYKGDILPEMKVEEEAAPPAAEAAPAAAPATETVTVEVKPAEAATAAVATAAAAPAAAPAPATPAPVPARPAETPAAEPAPAAPAAEAPAAPKPARKPRAPRKPAAPKAEAAPKTEETPETPPKAEPGEKNAAT